MVTSLGESLVLVNIGTIHLHSNDPVALWLDIQRFIPSFSTGRDLLSLLVWTVKNRGLVVS